MTAARAQQAAHGRPHETARRRHRTAHLLCLWVQKVVRHPLRRVVPLLLAYYVDLEREGEAAAVLEKHVNPDLKVWGQAPGWGWRGRLASRRRLPGRRRCCCLALVPPARAVGR
jgi:hypothetical protein